MTRDPIPATVAILAPVPAGITAAGFAPLVDGARRSGIPVTWSAAADDLGRLAVDQPAESWALSLDGASLEQRQDLRATLSRVRRTLPHLDAVVLPASATVAHRDLLVETGIRTAVVERFDAAPRGMRRPAPDGWPCRSILWGLWEVETTTAPRGGLLGRLMPWSTAPAPGSFRLVDVGTARDGRESAILLGRTLDRQSTHRGAVRWITLADLPALLGGAAQTKGGSVLRAA